MGGLDILDILDGLGWPREDLED